MLQLHGHLAAAYCYMCLGVQSGTYDIRLQHALWALYRYRVPPSLDLMISLPAMATIPDRKSCWFLGDSCLSQFEQPFS